MTVYLNMGTEDEKTLKKAIDLHNKLVKISNGKMKENDEMTFVRKVIKIFTLTLKVDENENPINLSDKNNQLIIHKLPYHSAIETKNLENFLSIITHTKLSPFSGITCNFFFSNKEHNYIVWHYFLQLCHISDAIFNDDEEDEGKIVKFNHALSKLGEEIQSFNTDGTFLTLDKNLKEDQFLQLKLETLNVHANDESSLTEDQEEKLAKLGIRSDGELFKLVGPLMTQLTGEGVERVDMSAIIQSVTSGIMSKGQSLDQEKLQNEVGGIINLFRHSDILPQSVKDRFMPLIDRLQGGEMNQAEAMGSLTGLLGEDKADEVATAVGNFSGNPDDIAALAEKIGNTDLDD